mmetsp:Transcript_26671/g.41838  ORF Transcript_26671/g.41838 Transcript_26671/m.41838 type:complete len:391 (-) Transcript_26671:234-1406(-)
MVILMNTETMSSNEKHYQLWKPRNNSNGPNVNGRTSSTDLRRPNYYLQEEADFFRVRNSRFCVQQLTECQQIPPHRSLVELINSTLVVGQEVSLAVILLAVHREIVTYEENTDGKMSDQTVLEYTVEKSSIAMLLVYTSMFIITYYNQRALTADLDDDVTSADCDKETSQHNHKKRKKGHRRKKAIVRLSDGILLAVMLRVISGLLRSLTASYSTDTVYALAVTGMSVHLLACDYKFANGYEKDEYSGGGGGDTPSLTRTTHHPRPKFLGGTVSLNAAFFATVLLISRINSNLTSYAFVSSVVTLFAFYPTSRHEIARHFPNRLWVSPCFAITASLTVSAWLLLVSSVERCMFVGLQLFLLLLSPCLQWWLQRYKKIITGKWDIAHINVT